MAVLVIVLDIAGRIVIERLAGLGVEAGRPVQLIGILLAVHRIADRRCVDAGADIEAPHFLQGLGVIGREGSVQMAEEHQIAGGRECTGEIGVGELRGGLGLARHRVDSLEAAIERNRPLGSAAGEPFAEFRCTALVLHILLFDRPDVIAAFDRRNVEQAELRIVGRGLPVLAALDRGA